MPLTEPTGGAIREKRKEKEGHCKIQRKKREYYYRHRTGTLTTVTAAVIPVSSFFSKSNWVAFIASRSSSSSSSLLRCIHLHLPESFCAETVIPRRLCLGICRQSISSLFPPLAWEIVLVYIFFPRSHGVPQGENFVLEKRGRVNTFLFPRGETDRRPTYATPSAIHLARRRRRRRSSSSAFSQPTGSRK